MQENSNDENITENTNVLTYKKKNKRKSDLINIL